MTKLLNTLALLFFVLLVQVSKAQESQALEDTFLWKVEHPTLEKPSFLFGTLHMMCPDDFSMPPKVARTLASVDALVLELNLSDPEEMQSMQASMAAKQKVSEEITPTQFEQLDTLVQRVVGTPLAALDAYGLSMVNMIMITNMLPCKQLKSFEAELMQLAIAKEMPIYSLEKVKEQIAIVAAAYPTDFAYQQLMLFESYKKDFNAAIISYNNDEITKTVAYLTKEEYMDDNAVKLMQIDRNKNWVEQMPKMMEERSNLFAVGAAHLTHSYGIIQLLRDRGYTVSPVFN